MNKQDIYRLLEEKQLSYKDYSDMPVEDISEALVAIRTGEFLTAQQVDRDMVAYAGESILVRKSVLTRLQKAARALKDYDMSLTLEVVYGYRALEIQKQLFEKFKSELSEQYDGDALLAATHRLVAVPEVAGHPAGAAVDIQIIQGGKPLDFGTKIWEFVPDSFTFSPFMNKEAWDNRQLLRRVMMGAGFAPFDGEWWHFSYGDKEWAKYYSKEQALYGQIDFREKKV
jgi:zinc D-Ala-D-Ala dipeptidase